MYYIGPVDGHNMVDLVGILEKVKAMPAPGPVLIHIVTEKGKGYPPAEAAADRMHGENGLFFFIASNVNIYTSPGLKHKPKKSMDLVHIWTIYICMYFFASIRPDTRTFFCL